MSIILAGKEYAQCACIICNVLAPKGKNTKDAIQKAKAIGFTVSKTNDVLCKKHKGSPIPERKPYVYTPPSYSLSVVVKKKAVKPTLNKTGTAPKAKGKLKLKIRPKTQSKVPAVFPTFKEFKKMNKPKLKLRIRK
jgi:hypothetical protein